MFILKKNKQSLLLVQKFKIRAPIHAQTYVGPLLRWTFKVSQPLGITHFWKKIITRTRSSGIRTRLRKIENYLDPIRTWRFGTRTHKFWNRSYTSSRGSSLISKSKWGNVQKVRCCWCSTCSVFDIFFLILCIVVLDFNLKISNNVSNFS